ncbi:MAG TPA: hypothetical protein VEL70_01745 [Candidatus Acidoferrum sp.]|nr:hypothetical protein [Candidatus Acidoferrum sp.]
MSFYEKMTDNLTSLSPAVLTTLCLGKLFKEALKKGLQLGHATTY